MSLLLRFALAALLPALVASIQVAPNSPCSSLCLSNEGLDRASPTFSSINTSDISCSDADYATEKGQKFEACMNCLQKSNYKTEEENDQAWFIYNIRFAADWCLYGNNNTQAISGPCMVEGTCKNLDAALATALNTPSVASTFEYCTTDNGMFLQRVGACHTCLQHMEGYSYVSNFVTALEAGCRQLPNPLQLISLDGSLFSSDPVNATEPRFDNIVVPTKKADGLDVGEILGIALAGLFVILLVLSCTIIQIHKRRRSRKLTAHIGRYQPRFRFFGGGKATVQGHAEYSPDNEQEAQNWGEKPSMFSVEMSEVPSRSPSPIEGSIYTKASNPSTSTDSLQQTDSPLVEQKPAVSVSIAKHRPSLSIITNASTAAPPIPLEPVPALKIEQTAPVSTAESRTHIIHPQPDPAPPTIPVSGPPNPLRMNSYRSSTTPAIALTTWTPDSANPYSQPFPLPSSISPRSGGTPARQPHFVFPQRSTNTPPPAFHRPLTASAQLPAYNPSHFSPITPSSRSGTPVVVSPIARVGLGIARTQTPPVAHTPTPPALPPRSTPSTPQLLSPHTPIPQSATSSRSGTPQLLPNGLPIPPPPPGPPPSKTRSQSVGRSHSFRPPEQQKIAFQNIASWLAVEASESRGPSPS